jgi:hypothetical protein
MLKNMSNNPIDAIIPGSFGNLALKQQIKVAMTQKFNRCLQENKIWLKKNTMHLKISWPEGRKWERGNYGPPF